MLIWSVFNYAPGEHFLWLKLIKESEYLAEKFYAVRAGRKPGIYKKWDDCKAQVMGFSGAVYKKFESLTEAQAFMDVEKSQSTSENDKQLAGLSAENEDDALVSLPLGSAVAYVDGSYDNVSKCYAAGAVIFFNGTQTHISLKYDDKELVTMRNVAGEIKASQLAMEFAINNHADSITIYHDYEGIARWCTGEWKANLKGTQDYRDYYKSLAGKIKISFMKVKGHSGVKYNELADKLAKAALGK